MSAITDECGAHCGINNFGGSGYTGHCEGCHNRTCEASKYDREEVKARAAAKEAEAIAKAAKAKLLRKAE